MPRILRPRFAVSPDVYQGPFVTRIPIGFRATRESGERAADNAPPQVAEKSTSMATPRD